MVHVLVLGTLACGGNGDDGGSAGGGATTTVPGAGASTTVAAPAEAAADDHDAVNKIALQASDFPPGWTSAPFEGEDDESERTLASCLGLEYAPDRPRANSAQFSKGELTQAGSSAELAPSTEVAAAEFAAIKGPKANACIKQQFDKELAEDSGGAAFAPVKVQALQFPKAGDETHALRLTTAVTAPDGSSVPIHADAVFVRKGRAEMTLFFLNAGEPFPSALAADLTQKLASRA